LARLLSVNVGLPRDIVWRGRTVRTGIWKAPVRGRCHAGRLNLAGDGQGDLAGHGGEQRAVLAYQIDSYRYWEAQLRRSGFVLGQFGENFTIAGLADDAVCIGDRYRIGSAVFEVTQPRVTCYRLGIRLDEARMPALLTSAARPGFYLRVLQEGEVGAHDDIVKVGEAEERMTVAEANALLYSAQHPRDRLESALRIAALSPGWRASFAALLDSRASGNAGLLPQAASHPAAPGFRPLAVAAIDEECVDVRSLALQGPDGQQLPTPLPGQYVVVRMSRPDGGAPLFRSYSLSGAVSSQRYRISVKIEANGAAGTYLRDHVRVGGMLDVSAPRGAFVLQTGERPVVLLSAGIGATPVLAMLHALAGERSPQPVLWLHGARDHRHHPFGAEVDRLLRALPHGRRHVCFSSPEPGTVPGSDFDAVGRLSRSVFEHVGVPRDSDVYLCGPAPFMAEMKTALAGIGVEPGRIRAELFNGSESMTPGVIAAPARAPHPPAEDAGAGPLVSFARSGVAAHWDPIRYLSILDLAEACDVPVRWSCRAGVCHNCESGLVSGTVTYEPAPLDLPAEGNVLVCCSQPLSDVVVDL
jgi:ferredoxin-NADP reductase/MOSC domain-containing protein YiiM